MINSHALPSGRSSHGGEMGHMSAYPNYWWHTMPRSNLLTFRRTGTSQITLTHEDWNTRLDLDSSHLKSKNIDEKISRASVLFRIDLCGEPCSVFGMNFRYVKNEETFRFRPNKFLGVIPIEEVYDSIGEYIAGFNNRIFCLYDMNCSKHESHRYVYYTQDMEIGPPVLRLEETEVSCYLRTDDPSRFTKDKSRVVRLKKNAVTPSGRWASSSVEYQCREWINDPRTDISHLIWKPR